MPFRNTPLTGLPRFVLAEAIERVKEKKKAVNVLEKNMFPVMISGNLQIIDILVPSRLYFQLYKI